MIYDCLSARTDLIGLHLDLLAFANQNAIQQSLSNKVSTSQKPTHTKQLTHNYQPCYLFTALQHTWPHTRNNLLQTFIGAAEVNVTNDLTGEVDSRCYNTHFMLVGTDNMLIDVGRERGRHTHAAIIHSCSTLSMRSIVLQMTNSRTSFQYLINIVL